MAAAVKILTLIDIVFILMLMLSASFTGVVSELVYCAAFFIPFAIGFYYSKRLKYEREEQRGLFEPNDRFFTLKKEKIPYFIPLIFPTVAIVFVLAALTSLLLTYMGFANAEIENQGIVTMLISHALAPAIFEELLFRYIPMKLISPYSKRLCVLLSALYFALIHTNLFQMPYAFAAGVIFMIIDLALDSVWPSVILHFINNAFSVVWMKYCVNEINMSIFIGILVALSVISMVFVLVNRKKYITSVRSALDIGAGLAMTNAPVALVVISMYISLMNLLA